VNNNNHNNSHNKSENSRALKRSKTGMEAEIFLLNQSGKVVHEAEKVISEVKKADGSIPIIPESGKHLIEFTCYPDVQTYNPALDLINSIEKTEQVCERLGIVLFPFGTYPGKFDPVFYEKDIYRMKEKIFGPDRFKHASRVAGYHTHYTLPKGVYDSKTKMIRLMKKSKLGRSLMGSYNFEIAADPSLFLFLQSSPFYQGIQKAKCSKVVMYRGGSKLDSMDGLYANHQQIGGLPPYKQTATDLINSLKRRWTRWENEIKKVAPGVKMDELYPSLLDIFWGPVRINKIGTLEERGLDMNFMSVCIATTALLKFCLKKIHREFVEVIPADFAVDEPFKVENGILYVPPHTYVRNKLQKFSAYQGHQNKEIHRYSERLYKFAKSLTPKHYHKIIKPIGDMIENKESISDRIIKQAKRKGYLIEGSISNKDSAELALYFSKLFHDDLEKTKHSLLKIKTV
jgi:hypothetical protein